MYGPQNKCCFVPRCKSTSVSTPHKVFMTVPTEYYLKSKWFKAARRDMTKSKTVFFCCEDHFNLEEDMQNYIRYKLMGGRIFLKPGVVPHLFDCQEDRKRASSVLETLLPIKRERKQLIEEESDKQQPNLLSISYCNEPSTSSATHVTTEEIISTLSDIRNIPEVPTHRSVGVQVRPSFRSKYISCNLRVSVQHTATSSIEPEQTDRSTPLMKKYPRLKAISTPPSKLLMNRPINVKKI